ncbi:hypothetical protein EVJ58_g9408 [Rhodofomes roseus]|nr:hypothetical protein EVJ58_g9408 [Rhodofomes roseus]
MPLEIAITSSSRLGPVPRVLALLNVLDAELYRVRRLRIEYSSEASAPDAVLQHRIFARVAPRLEGLSIEIDGLIAPVAPGMLPEQFQTNAPDLRRLCLRCIVPWINNRFPSLTHLWLSRVRPVLLTDFLTFMEASPNLAHFTLDTSGPISNRRGRPRTAQGVRVIMPHLRTVSIWGCSWRVAACVLQHLVLPATTAVEVSAMEGVASHAPLFALLPPRIAFLQNTGPPTKLSLWLHAHKICVSCAGPTGSLELQLSAHRRARLTNEVHSAWATSVLTLLPAALDLSQVEDLSLIADHLAPVPTRVVQGFFLKMRTVQSCTLWIDSSLNRQYWTRCLSPRDTAPPFPRLKRLRFVGRFAKTWVPSQMMSIVIRRSDQGCDKLEELVCTAIEDDDIVPDFVGWNVDALMHERRRILDYVNSVQLESLRESPMQACIIELWDGTC